jgi:hypothetical protein
VLLGARHYVRAQHGRVSSYVGAARGARLVIGARRPDGFDDGWFFEPRVFKLGDP